MTDTLDDSYESDLTDEESTQLLLMSEHAIAPPLMPPQEAGFDGAKGININHPAMPGGGVFRLRRSVHAPWEYAKDCRNQLIWQESEPPHLYYCNSEGKWFELSFTPIQPE